MLTLWYLAIIIAISLTFSGLLYRVSSIDLEHGANRQIGYFNNFLRPEDYSNYRLFRQAQLDEDRGRLKANLVVFNLMVLVGGGVASYWLARRTLQPIELALDAQSRFTADASHELRTPLTAIQTENEVALRNPSLSKAEAIALLKSNLEEVAKLKTLSEGLLRLANGGHQLDDTQIVILNDVITAAYQRLKKVAKQKSVDIKLKIPDIKIRGNHDSLVELFAIFIDNALKYSPSHSSVLISAQARGKEILVIIKDHGQGIASTEMPNIFERFYRADSSRSKNNTEGYGLGLAIAKQIVQMHGGHIDVSSTLGKGSVFTVHLPAA